MEIFEEFERESKERAKAIRQEIRERRFGLLKILGIETIPLAIGFGLGALAKATEAPWVPIVPIAIDILPPYGNCSSFSSLRGLWGLAKYIGGVTLAYPGIYEGLRQYLSK
ncbi:MAG: hypothetical protein AABY16_00270 [Nanoarchaeota archaeon]